MQGELGPIEVCKGRALKVALWRRIREAPIEMEVGSRTITWFNELAQSFDLEGAMPLMAFLLCDTVEEADALLAVPTLDRMFARLIGYAATVAVMLERQRAQEGREDGNPP
jgi:hypothetical protein